MADIKREQEREELHRAIWAIADELRGAVDGWDFKNYVLGTMFYGTFPKTSPTTSIRLKSLGFLFVTFKLKKCYNILHQEIEVGKLCS